MIKKSKKHLRMVNESYFQHMGVASSIGIKMMLGGLMAMIHGFIPALFRTSASDRIKELYNFISQKR